MRSSEWPDEMGYAGCLVGSSVPWAAAGSTAVVGGGCHLMPVINSKCLIINNGAAKTYTESPLLTAAASCYSINTMIDISLLQVIIYKIHHPVQVQSIYICPIWILGTPTIIYGYQIYFRQFSFLFFFFNEKVSDMKYSYFFKAN